MLLVRLGLALALTMVVSASYGEKAFDKVHHFDIPQQDLATALNLFAHQAEQPVFFQYNRVRGLSSTALQGDYSVNKGLAALIGNAGLVPVFSANGVLTVTAAVVSDNKSVEDNMNLKTKQATGLFALLAALMGASHADTVSAASPGKPHSKSVLLEEIIVTAQKKATGEAAHNVPIAISAYSGSQIEAMFAKDVTDIALRIPNAQLDPQGSGPGVASFFIRGAGVIDSTPSTDPAVGVIVDGMFLGLPWGVITDVFDLESVEILRGPQGTLFGRNVTGGAVLLKSRLPSGEFGFRAKTTVGSDGRADLALSVENALTEDLAGKVSLLYKSQGDYYDNVVSGVGDSGESESFVVRPSLVWTLSDKVEINFIAEIGDQKLDSSSTKAAPVTQIIRGLDLGDFEFANSFEPQSSLEWWHTIINASWQLDNGVITSITAYREVEAFSGIDPDASALSIFSAFPYVEQNQFSQEFIYATSFNEKIDLSTGVYFFKQNLLNTEEYQLSGGALIDFSEGKLDHETVGIFAQADINVTEKLTLTVGGRFSSEEKSLKSFSHFSQPACTNTPSLPGCDFNESEKWTSFSPKLGLQYFFNDDVQTYISWNRAFRSGGFSVRTTAPANTPGPYDEEQVDVVELGIKAVLADGNILLNASVFQNNYQDMQRVVATAGGVALDQRILNAAEATINGAELDITAAINERWVVMASLGYIDASYDKFEGLDVDLDGTADPDLAKNLKLAHVPKLNYSVSTTYDIPLEKGTLTFRGSYSWTDERYNDDVNSFILEDYGLLDGSVTFKTNDNKWGISLFGKNLMNEEWFSSGFALSFATYTYLNPPRTYGVEVDYTF